MERNNTAEGVAMAGGVLFAFLLLWRLTGLASALLMGTKVAVTDILYPAAYLLSAAALFSRSRRWPGLVLLLGYAGLHLAALMLTSQGISLWNAVMSGICFDLVLILTIVYFTPLRRLLGGFFSHLWFVPGLLALASFLVSFALYHAAMLKSALIFELLWLILRDAVQYFRSVLVILSLFLLCRWITPLKRKKLT